MSILYRKICRCNKTIYLKKQRNSGSWLYLCGERWGTGWETTWLDDGYVKVLAFVLNGRLAATYHIIKNHEINTQVSENKTRKPGFPRKQPDAGALLRKFNLRVMMVREKGREAGKSGK